MSCKKHLNIFLSIIIIQLAPTFFSCDNGNNNIIKFPRNIKIKNTVQTLGIIATEIDSSYFIPSDNTIVPIKDNAKLIEDCISVDLFDYGTAYINVFNNAGNHSVVYITLWETNSEIPKIGTNNSNNYEQGFSIYSGEYFNMDIEKAVDINIFNGNWQGIFENGYLIEEIVLQNGEFTITKNNYNFYRGTYYTTEKKIYFRRYKIWEGSSWNDMAEQTDIKRYILESNRIKLFDSSEMNNEKIYERK
jgi:hypothetical protein